MNNRIHVGVLSNGFESFSDYKEVEEDLIRVGILVKDSLESLGYDATFFDVDEKTFEKLRKSNIDIVFNVCERFNGNSLFEPHIAAMLELLGIPYTGSGPLTLATCMNKIRVKEILKSHNIITPKYQVFNSKNKKLDPDINFPLIVKPSRMHNSIGIANDSVVRSEQELKKKVDFILRTYNQAVLVEEYIEGRDLDVGILGNKNNLIHLPIIEVYYKDLPEDMNKIFSYDAKWNKESLIYQNTAYAYPADLPKYLENKVKKIAAAVYTILECRDYGRVDIRLSKDNVPYVLEMNPNPGISADCSTPIAAESIGISYKDMVHKIFCNALERYDMLNTAISDVKQENKSLLVKTV